MGKTKRGLGRGLDALIPSTPGQWSPTEVGLDSIQPNPRQPRRSVEGEDLQALAGSIRDHGIIQPLVVTSLGDGRYQLIAGERRWRAAKLAGLAAVPVIVKEVSPRGMLELALVENLQRADLNPLEEAEAYRQLIEEFDLTQDQVAERVGKSRVAVTNSLRLLHLPTQAREALAKGEITEGHGRALLGARGEAVQLQLLQAIRERSLTVRQTEELVRRLNRGDREISSPRSVEPAPELKALEDAFRRALGTRVSLSQGAKGGRLTVHFYSDEELQRIYDLIVGD